MGWVLLFTTLTAETLHMTMKVVLGVSPHSTVTSFSFSFVGGWLFHCLQNR